MSCLLLRRVTCLLRGSPILHTIHDDELVTARAVSISPSPPISNPVDNIRQSYPSKPAKSTEPSRIQISLVTAQLTRAHARATLQDGSTTLNNTFAFDGAFINGNASLVTIRDIPCTGIVISDMFLFRLLFDVKPLVHLVGSQKMI